MQVGFIGLGQLGRAMAQRLIDQGVELTVWNRTASKAEGLGVPVAASPAELAAGCDPIFINVFDSQAVREVLSGSRGVLAAGCEGKTIIDTTTNHFEDVRSLYGLCARQMAHYLEAPILGSVIPASQGKVTICVSGVAAAWEVAKPYLEILGEQIFYLPTPTMATRMKLVNNLTLGAFMAAIAEALVLGEAAGLERKMVLDILAAGAGKSGVLAAKTQKLLDDDYATHFASRAIYKDLHLVQDLARSVKRYVFMASTAKELFGLNAATGADDEDFSVVYQTLRDL